MNSTRRQKIVVGVSGSVASAAALRWASADAQRRHARLHAVRAWESPQRAAYAPADGTVSRDALRRRAVDELSAAVRAVWGTAPPSYVTAQVAEGHPCHVLADQSGDADLLVLGSSCAVCAVQEGRPIGPVIRACLHRARCPVLIIDPGLLGEPDAGLRRDAQADGTANLGGRRPARDLVLATAGSRL